MTNSDDSEHTPGRTFGAGDADRFYHIEILSKKDFKVFRTLESGADNGIKRVIGQRTDGTWETVKWIIRKGLARVENGILIAVRQNAEELFANLKSPPIQIRDNIFQSFL